MVENAKSLRYGVEKVEISSNGRKRKIYKKKKNSPKRQNEEICLTLVTGSS